MLEFGVTAGVAGDPKLAADASAGASDAGAALALVAEFRALVDALAGSGEPVQPDGPASSSDAVSSEAVEDPGGEAAVHALSVVAVATGTAATASRVPAPRTAAPVDEPVRRTEAAADVELSGVDDTGASLAVTTAPPTTTPSPAATTSATGIPSPTTTPSTGTATAAPDVSGESTPASASPAPAVEQAASSSVEAVRPVAGSPAAPGRGVSHDELAPADRLPSAEAPVAPRAAVRTADRPTTEVPVPASGVSEHANTARAPEVLPAPRERTAEAAAPVLREVRQNPTDPGAGGEPRQDGRPAPEQSRPVTRTSGRLLMRWPSAATSSPQVWSRSRSDETRPAFELPSRAGSLQLSGPALSLHLVPASPSSHPIAAATPVAPAPAAPTYVASADLPETTGHQIVQALRLQWSRGVGEATIRLQPHHFGELSVALRVEQGQVVARLEAESPVVREWLQTNQASLRASLADHHLTLDRLDVVEPQRDAEDAEPRQRQSRRDDAEPRPSARRDDDEDARFEVVA